MAENEGAGVLRWFLEHAEVEAPTYETPWGRGRSVDMPTLRAIHEGRRSVTWAELWVIARDWHEAQGADPSEAAMLATAETMEKRAATAHERVKCPTCAAEVGKVCRGMPRGWRRDPRGNRGRLLKNSHVDRLRADGVELR